MRLILAVCALLPGFQDGADIDALIRKLGASDIAEREKASRAVLERGQSVRPALDKAAGDPDGEIAARAKSILATLDRDVDALALVLERIRNNSRDSYQRMLRDSAHALRVACEGKNVDVISKSLERQGFPLQGKRFFHEVKEYLAKEAAYVAPSGLKHDLRLRLELAAHTSRSEATRWIVKHTEIELVARPAIGFADMAAKAYPAGTVLQYALDHKVSKEAAKNFPELTEIRINYGPGRFSHRDKTSYWGFHIVVEFANRDKTAGTSTTFFTPSDLDPCETDGVKDDANFAPADTWEPMWASGGGGWSRPKNLSSLRRIEEKAEDPKSKSKPAEVLGVGDLRALPENSTDIRISGEDFGAEDCGELLRFSKIKSLSWTYEKPVSGKAIEILAGLKSLESLDLIGWGPLSDEDCERISGLSNLVFLRISDAQSISDAGAAHLSKLGNLSHLNLGWCGRLGDASMKSFAGLKKLEALHLHGSAGLTDKALKCISEMAQVKRLSFSHSQNFTEAGWRYLGEMKGLRYLSVGCLSLDDKGLAAFGGLTSLESLNLWILKDVSDVGLRELKGLKHLKKLDFRECPGITIDGLRELQSALPGKYTLE